MDGFIELVEAAKGRRVDAFEQLVRRFQNMAFGYACSILGDVHLAEDAVQEAMLEAYERLPTLEHPAAFPAWLRRVVLKHCDRQTRGKRIKAVVYADAEPTTLEWEPSQTFARQETTQQVLRAVRTLPERQREIAHLFYLKDCSQQDIAAFLDVPISTIKKRLQQARKLLKDRMLQVAEDALRNNYLDDSFASHLVAGLLSRLNLLRVNGHPVRDAWDDAKAALPAYEIVAGDEIEDVRAARLFNSESCDHAFYVDRRQVLRTHALGSLLRASRGRTAPVRLLTAGRAFRNCAEDARTRRVFHQLEGLCIDRQPGDALLKSTVDRLLRQLAPDCDVRWQAVPSETLESGYCLAIKNQHGLCQVGGAGIVRRDLLIEAGIDVDSLVGIAFSFELDRLAMLRRGVGDVREFWGPQYCPVENNFEQIDPREALAEGGYSLENATTMPISGIIPGAGKIAPGQTWMTQDGVLHIRDEIVTENRIEGDWVGSERIELNLDLDRDSGDGIVRNKTEIDVFWAERGLRGKFRGVFAGPLTHGGACGRGAFHGSGGFAGMKAIVQAKTPDLGEPFQYEGVVIEPRRKS